MLRILCGIWLHRDSLTWLQTLDGWLLLLTGLLRLKSMRHFIIMLEHILVILDYKTLLDWRWRYTILDLNYICHHGPFIGPLSRCIYCGYFSEMMKSSRACMPSNIKSHGTPAPWRASHPSYRIPFGYHNWINNILWLLGSSMIGAVRHEYGWVAILIKEVSSRRLVEGTLKVEDMVGVQAEGPQFLLFHSSLFYCRIL